MPEARQQFVISSSPENLPVKGRFESYVKLRPDRKDILNEIENDDVIYQLGEKGTQFLMLSLTTWQNLGIEEQFETIRMSTAEFDSKRYSVFSELLEGQKALYLTRNNRISCVLVRENLVKKLQTLMAQTEAERNVKRLMDIANQAIGNGRIVDIEVRGPDGNTVIAHFNRDSETGHPEPGGGRIH